jgi:hypothetical protein
MKKFDEFIVENSENDVNLKHYLEFFKVFFEEQYGIYNQWNNKMANGSLYYYANSTVLKGESRIFVEFGYTKSGADLLSDEYLENYKKSISLRKKMMKFLEKNSVSSKKTNNMDKSTIMYYIDPNDNEILKSNLMKSIIGTSKFNI